MKEEWRPLKGFEKKYIISNQGNIISLNYARTGIKKKIKNIKGSNGYYFINLYRGGSQRPYYIHRLVAETFIPNPNKYPVVDHIDANPLNNCISNLRWTTIKGNVNNPISHKRRVAAVRKRYLGKTGVDAARFRAVVQLNTNGEIIKKWDCISDAWRETGIGTDAIVRCCQREYVHSGGYIWIYGDQYSHDEVCKRVSEYMRLYSPILQLSTDYKIINEWKSTRSIKDGLNLHMGSIRACCRRERKTSHGFIWRFKNDITEEERWEIEKQMQINRKYL